MAGTPRSSRSAAVGARIERTTNQTGIATGALTPVVFESVRYDHGGLANLGAQATRLTVPAGEEGVYVVSGGWVWDADTTGNRWAFLRVNGTTHVGEDMRAAVAANVSGSAVGQWEFVAGDYVELVVQQNSGANRALLGSATPRVFLALAKVV